MRAVVVYESMYGNTHLIADAIGRGLGAAGDVVVMPVKDASREWVEGADVVVVGGPTHVHGMSRTSTRKAAVDAAHEPDSPLSLDPDADGPGLRDWLASLGRVESAAAAFDTRIKAPAAVTGRASKGISRELRGHGFAIVAKPESFFVTKEGHLEPGEEARALEWGRRLAGGLVRSNRKKDLWTDAK